MDGRITSFGNRTPVIARSAFVDVSSRIIGDVTVGEGASIWPMAVLRADSSTIFVGARSSVLDLSLVEAPQGFPVLIEDGVLVSHNAVIHGARLSSGSLVGIGAIVLEGAVIAGGCIVAAGTVVTPGTRVPSNSLIVGSPGRIARQTTEQERRMVSVQLDELYEKSRRYLRSRPA